MTVGRLFVFLSVIGYALQTRGGWTREMLIADWEELEEIRRIRSSCQKIQFPRCASRQLLREIHVSI